MKHILASLLLAALAVSSAAAVDFIQKEDFGETSTGWKLAGQFAASVAAEPFVIAPPIKGGPTNALRLKLDPPAEAQSYNQMLVIDPTNPLGPGKTVTLKAWMRSPEALSVTLIGKKSGQEPFVAKRVELTPEWQEFTVEGVTQEDYKKSYYIAIQLGSEAGTVEVAGLEISAKE